MPPLTSSSAGGGSSALSCTSAVVMVSVLPPIIHGDVNRAVGPVSFLRHTFFIILPPSPYTGADDRPPCSGRPRFRYQGCAREGHRGVQQLALLRLP